MTALVHCDGPACTAKLDPSEPNFFRMGRAGWRTLTERGDITPESHFCSTTCLAEWATTVASLERAAEEQRAQTHAVAP